MTHTILCIPKKIVGRIRKTLLIRKFGQLDITSSIGTDGCGRHCILEGIRHMYIGTDCFIDDECEIVCQESHFEQKYTPKLTLGNHVRIRRRCRITCTGNIAIGNDVLFAPEVFITDHNHGMDADFSGGGYSPQPQITKDVAIGDGVWIGQRAIVLPGVTIGAHSIIGAGSVVTHSVPPYSMAAGNPATIIKRWDSKAKQWQRV